MEIYFAKNVKYLRSLRNMTQADLAAYFECTPPTVTRWEIGVSYPRFAELVQLRQYFDVDLERLVFTDLTQDGSLVNEMRKNYGDAFNQKLNEMLDKLEALQARVEDLERNKGE